MLRSEARNTTEQKQHENTDTTEQKQHENIDTAEQKQHQSTRTQSMTTEGIIENAEAKAAAEVATVMVTSERRQQWQRRRQIRTKSLPATSLSLSPSSSGESSLLSYRCSFHQLLLRVSVLLSSVFAFLSVVVRSIFMFLLIVICFM